MISDSLTNSIATDTGKLYVPEEFKVFGENSVVYNRTSEITEAKAMNQRDDFVKGWIAVGLSIYILLIFLTLKGRMTSIHRMFVSYRFAKKQYEETSRVSTLNTTYIILFTIIVVSVQFSLLNNYQEYGMAIVPFLSLLGIFIVQSAALKLIALVCHSESIMGEINLNRNLYLSISGISIMPLTVLALLYEGSKVETAALIASEILLGLLVLFMMIRLSKIFFEAKVSYLFRFLYLCVFEISPYLALFVVFENIN
ncbi:MAG: DUF4271 domain-containing protein [Prevotellaceae bacterium]|jgi:hypothetical protein|nr:DUF4271 domain-containing protein [Prevotellaceae bacterium]